jgi:chaperone required for assembly of F1-ATPase
MKAPVALPTQRLAEAIAAEWRAQGQRIDPFSMPLTRLANTAIDRVVPHRSRIVEEMVKFAGSDLLCYRAQEPDGLIARQAAAWDPVIIWAQRQLDAGFRTTAGVVFYPQTSAALAAMRGYIEGKPAWALAPMHNIVTLTGSALLAAMIAEGDISGDDAWRAAHIDEDWQIEHWGVDAEAQARRDHRRHEFDMAIRFLSLLET